MFPQLSQDIPSLQQLCMGVAVLPFPPNLLKLDLKKKGNFWEHSTWSKRLLKRALESQSTDGFQQRQAQIDRSEFCSKIWTFSSWSMLKDGGGRWPTVCQVFHLTSEELDRTRTRIHVWRKDVSESLAAGWLCFAATYQVGGYNIDGWGRCLDRRCKMDPPPFWWEREQGQCSSTLKDTDH